MVSLTNGHAMHSNLRPSNVTPVILSFNYEADIAPAYKFNKSATSTDHNSPTANFSTMRQTTAGL